jgi:hypothetical protein
MLDYDGLATELTMVMGQLLEIEQPLILQKGPARRLGSVIRATAAMLVAPIHIAKPDSIVIARPENFDTDYRGLLLSLFRCALTGAHIYFEESLLEWCNERNIAIPTSQYDTWVSLMSELEEAKLSPQGKKKMRRLRPNNKPSSQDIATAALSVLSKDRRKVWQDFLDAVAIIRNKLSHSQPATSPSDQERLRKADMGNIIAPSGELILDPSIILNVIQKLLKFFDEIDRARPLQ